MLGGLGKQSTIALVASLLAVYAVATSTVANHADNCQGLALDTCEDSWIVPTVANPAWWRTTSVLDTHTATKSNRPAWIHVETSNPPVDPYQVTLNVTGAVVGSLDVFEVHQGFGTADTPDKLSPRCPQGLVYDFYPEGSADPGSPSHVSQARQMILRHHQTVVPTPDDQGNLAGSIHVNLSRAKEWVLVFDARAGTGTQLPPSSNPGTVLYNITVDSPTFTATSPPPKTLPFNVGNWGFNAGPCLTDIQLP